MKMESWSILPEGSGWNETTLRTREEAVAESVRESREQKLRFFYDPLAIRRQKFGFFFIILKNRTQPEIESVTRF